MKKSLKKKVVKQTVLLTPFQPETHFWRKISWIWYKEGFGGSKGVNIPLFMVTVAASATRKKSDRGSRCVRSAMRGGGLSRAAEQNADTAY